MREILKGYNWNSSLNEDIVAEFYYETLRLSEANNNMHFIDLDLKQIEQLHQITTQILLRENAKK